MYLSFISLAENHCLMKEKLEICPPHGIMSLHCSPNSSFLPAVRDAPAAAASDCCGCCVETLQPPALRCCPRRWSGYTVSPDEPGAVCAGPAVRRWPVAQVSSALRAGVGSAGP